MCFPLAAVIFKYRNVLIKNKNTKLTILNDKGLKFAWVLTISGKIILLKTLFTYLCTLQSA